MQKLALMNAFNTMDDWAGQTDTCAAQDGSFCPHSNEEARRACAEHMNSNRADNVLIDEG